MIFAGQRSLVDKQTHLVGYGRETGVLVCQVDAVDQQPHLVGAEDIMYLLQAQKLRVLKWNFFRPGASPVILIWAMTTATATWITTLMTSVQIDYSYL